MTDILTPADVEARLNELSRQLDDAQDHLADAEADYFDAKTAYELKAARVRVRLGADYSKQGIKVTVQEKEDLALLECQEEVTRLAATEAVVRAARSNIAKIRQQVEIARSLGASVRTSMELL